MGQPNMNQMLKQVQKMQADMAKAQEELIERLRAELGAEEIFEDESSD